MHFDLFQSVALVVAAGAVLVWLAQKAGQSVIVAYLALGVLIGPSVFDLLANTADVQHLSELGVVLLLFFVGLEFHLSTLKSLAKLAILGGALQVGVTTAAFAGVAILAGFGTLEAVIAGFCVSLSSTAIVMKAFEDRREQDSTTAQTCVALLIGQDLFALFALAVLPLVLQPNSGEGATANPWLKIGILLAGLPVFFFGIRKLLPIVFKRAALARNAEAFGLCSVAACLLVGVLAQAGGASMPLGAFLGGLVFADTPFAYQIRADLAVIKNLALGFFFVTVGMLMDLAFVADHAGTLLVALVVIVALKSAIAAGVLRGLRRPWSVAVAAGLALGQISEFALVVPTAALNAGVLTKDHYQLLVTLTVLTMIPAPFFVSRSRVFGRWLAERLGSLPLVPKGLPSAPLSAADEGEEPAPEKPVQRAIVVGYGPVGRTLCRILCRFGIDPCVIDLHFDTIRRLKEIGRHGIYGDAGRREVLVAAGVLDARYVIITLPDYAARLPIITSARACNPNVVIISRARYLDERKPLERAGAQLVAMEECEVAGELAHLLLDNLQVPKELLDAEVDKIRSEIDTRSGFTRMVQSPLWTPAEAN